MTYRVIYSPRSRRDLEKIRDHIALESASPVTASRFIVSLSRPGWHRNGLTSRIAAGVEKANAMDDLDQLLP